MENKIAKELKRGTLEVILLSLLVDEEKYGYQLVSEISEISGGIFSLGEGTLYPVLYRLEESKLIEPTWKAEGRGVPRKYYCITTEGKRQLDLLRNQWYDFVGLMDKFLGGNKND